ncbi:MAG: thioredoxin family protein [Bacteroidetes bacterium]|nr:thioredoxin family protein [Bacteroidota bacterium]
MPSALTPVVASPPQWHFDMREAQQIAQKEHKLILLNFSGSDWCGPCILLRKEILDAPAFSRLADSSLILVNADFPRMKKNQLSKEQQQRNDQLADQYNQEGKFPLTLLLNPQGKILKQWEGNPGVKPEEFCSQIRTIIESNPHE